MARSFDKTRAFPAPRMGLPGPELDLPVLYGGRVQGRFVLVPTPGWPVTHERVIVAVAVAGQVGAALGTRARIA